MSVDIVALLFLGLLMPIAIWFKSRSVRVGVIIVYLTVIVLTQISLEPMMRSVVSSRHAEGKWTEDFRDGAVSMHRAIEPCRPFIIVCAVGLAILGIRRNRDRNTVAGGADVP